MKKLCILVCILVNIDDILSVGIKLISNKLQYIK